MKTNFGLLFEWLLKTGFTVVLKTFSKLHFNIIVHDKQHVLALIYEYFLIY